MSRLMKEKLNIVKVGGAIVEKEESLAPLLKSFAALPGLKILVHGGGKIATSIAFLAYSKSSYPLIITIFVLGNSSDTILLKDRPSINGIRISVTSTSGLVCRMGHPRRSGGHRCHYCHCL